MQFYDITRQVQTEKKPVNNADLLPIIQTFHRELCGIQQSKGLNKPDPVFGSFPSLACTILIKFQLHSSMANEALSKGAACWVLNQGPSGLAKRSMTIIMTLRAADEQIIPPFILFRGEGCIDKELLEVLEAESIPFAFLSFHQAAHGTRCVRAFF